MENSNHARKSYINIFYKTIHDSCAFDEFQLIPFRNGSSKIDKEQKKRIKMFVAMVFERMCCVNNAWKYETRTQKLLSWHVFCFESILWSKEMMMSKFSSL